MVTRDERRRAVALLATIDGVGFDPNSLYDDVLALSQALPDPNEFRLAIAATRRALVQLSEGRIEGTPLRFRLSEWRSLHYQHKRGRGQRADMRIVYRNLADGVGIQVRGFGHRHDPQDIYRRLRERNR